jgi:3-oxoadipate enol-lactonase
METILNRLKIHFTDTGERNLVPAVLLHAFPLSGEMWQPQIEALRGKARCICPDHRGMGRSEGGDGQFTLEFLVDDLLALLDHLAVERAVLCGLSMGGYLAQRFHQRHPERVRGLILADTRSEADTDEGKLKRAAAMRLLKTQGIPAFAESFLPSAFTPAAIAAGTPAVEEARRLIHANSLQGLLGALLALATRTDTTASLAAIRLPTLLLVGAKDTLTPPSVMEKMKGRIPGARYKVIPRAGHFSNMENPEAFNRQVILFLKSTGPRRSQRRKRSRR